MTHTELKEKLKALEPGMIRHVLSLLRGRLPDVKEFARFAREYAPTGADAMNTLAPWQVESALEAAEYVLTHDEVTEEGVKAHLATKKGA